MEFGPFSFSRTSDIQKMNAKVEKMEETVSAVTGVIPGYEEFWKAQMDDNVNKASQDVTASSVNIRPSLMYLRVFTSENGIKIPIYPVSPILLYQLAWMSDIVRTILYTYKERVFRNGIKIVENFKYKCTNEECLKVFQETPKKEEADGQEEGAPICDDCKSPLREPCDKEKKRAESLKDDAINQNNQKLIDVLKLCEDDVNIMDDEFLVIAKEYHIDEAELKIVGSKINEVVRGNPLFLRIIADRTGRPAMNDEGKKIVTCVRHRSTAYPINPRATKKCPTCKLEMKPATHVINAHSANMFAALDDRGELYYVEGEVIHTSQYYPSNTYGYSPLVACWTKAITLLNMDRYIKEYYLRQRPPKSLLLVNTRNVDALKKSWKQLLAWTKIHPHIPHPLAIDSNSQRGQTAQYINLMDTLTDMQYIDARNQMRKDIGAVYGVMPLFAGDLQGAGGLNNEGLQITITTQAMESKQKTKNGILERLLAEYEIKDWRLEIEPAEERDELRDIQLETQKINNAIGMQALGFEVSMDEDGEFEFEQPKVPAGGLGETPFGTGEEPDTRPPTVKPMPPGVGGTRRVPMVNPATGSGVSGSPENVSRSTDGNINKGDVKKPFADYKDFADCVAKNKDKDNPEAYCATIQRQVEDTKKSESPHLDKAVKKELSKSSTPRPTDATAGLIKKMTYETESELIKENKKKPAAKEPHDFKQANWTHKNGHPRCLTCGDEESMSKRCNDTKADEKALKEEGPISKVRGTEELSKFAAKAAGYNHHYSEETELIADNKDKPEAKKSHIFNKAEWVSKNGIPRCLTCGDEPNEGGVCDSKELVKSILKEEGGNYDQYKKLMKKTVSRAENVPEEFTVKTLEEGTKVEMEHTDDKKVAEKIALDHLKEDPEYYKKLKTIEKPVDAKKEAVTTSTPGSYNPKFSDDAKKHQELSLPPTATPRGSAPVYAPPHSKKVYVKKMEDAPDDVAILKDDKGMYYEVANKTYNVRPKGDGSVDVTVGR